MEFFLKDNYISCPTDDELLHHGSLADSDADDHRECRLDNRHAGRVHSAYIPRRIHNKAKAFIITTY